MSRESARVLVALIILAIAATSGVAQAQVPPNAKGWRYYISISQVGYAADPVTACQLTAQHHMGTQLVRIERIKTDSPSVVGYLCYYPHSSLGGRVSAYGRTDLICETGFSRRWPGACVKDAIVEDPRQVDEPCGPSAAPLVGNPIISSTGSKYEEARDFWTAGPVPLEVRRIYRSSMLSGAPVASFGLVWSASFDRAVVVPDYSSDGSPYIVHVYQEDGSFRKYVRNTSGVFAPHYGTDKTSKLVYADSVNGVFEFTNEKNRTDSFQRVGTTSVYRLIASRTPAGLSQGFTYGADGKLSTITDSFGRSLSLTWDGAVVSRIDAPGGYRIQYGYDRLSLNGQQMAETERLLTVTRSRSDGGEAVAVTYHYEDPRNRYLITGLTDERGIRYATWAYDDQGRVTLSEHAGGTDRTEIVYNDTSNTRTITNALGKQAVYYFSMRDKHLRLNRIEGQPSTNCSASTVSLSYDTKPFIVSATDEEGRKTTYVRDARGLETSRTKAAGTSLARTVTTTWHPDFRLPTQIVMPGRRTDLVYDAAGRLTQRTETDTTTQTVPYSTQGQARTWNYTHTPQGLLETVDGPLPGPSDTTLYEYDAHGYLQRVTNALQHAMEVMAVNGRGLPTRIREPNGLILELAYDAHGQLSVATLNPGPGESAVSFGYDGTGAITQLISPTGEMLNLTYDNARRLTVVQNHLGERIEYTHDALGNIARTDVKTAAGAIVRTQTQVSDELGRLLRLVGAAAETTSFKYDKTDNVTEQTDPRGKIYGSTFDALNRLVAQSKPGGGQVALGRDAANNVETYADERGLVTQFVHNGFGDVIRETSPDRGVTDYLVNELGQVIQKTDARGITVEYTYDALGRMRTRTFPASPAENVTFSYDDTSQGNNGIGRLTGVADASGTTAFVYDTRGNVIEERRTIGGHTYTTRYIFDAANRVARMVYPSGRVVTYTRDGLGRIGSITTQASVEAPSETIVGSIAYHPFGSISSLTYGNGLSLAVSRNQNDWVTGLDLSDGHAPVLSLGYGQDAAGNVTSVTDALGAGHSQTLAYDDRGHLASATGAWGALSLTYDGVGNRRTQSLDSGAGPITQTYSYSATSNQLSAVITGGQSARTFSYTGDGRISIDDRGAQGLFVYSYNNNGRLASMNRDGAVLATYVYNGLEQRVIRTLGEPANATVHFVHDRNGLLLSEADAMGAIQREYIWFDNLSVAVVETVAGIPSMLFVHTNHLGLPLMMTDSTKAVIWTGLHTPFGEQVSLVGAGVQNLRFPGQYLQSEAGLHQNWYRDYDPSLGRYLQPDPLGLADGSSLYAYANSNPTNLVDPDGRFAAAFALGLFVGAVGEFATNMVASDYDFDTSWRCIDFTNVLLAGVFRGAKVPSLFSAGMDGFRWTVGKAKGDDVLVKAIQSGLGARGKYLLNQYIPDWTPFGSECKCKDLTLGKAIAKTIF